MALTAVSFAACENPNMAEILHARTVYFDSNGGIPVPPSQRVWARELLVRPADPVRAHSVFLGWYLDGIKWDFNVTPPLDRKRIDLRAEWEGAAYAVTFMVDGAEYKTEYAAIGGTVTLPSAPLPETVLIFTGWNTEADGSGTVFTAATAVTGNTTVYARWIGIGEYLGGQAGGGSAGNPVPLPLAVKLGVMTQAGSGWHTILDELHKAGKYVSLDLSACTMSGAEFDSDWNVINGKDRIVSITLPNAARSLQADGYNFYYFDNLRTVIAAEVTSIVDSAFYEHASLASVYIPKAASIGYSAFYRCASLASVSFPAATSIGYSAFGECASLASVYIPKAASIGNEAFYDCNSLTSVEIPAAASIGHLAFYRCASLASVSFPASATVDGSFARCPNLTSFTLTGTGNLSVAEGGRALIRNGTELVAYPSATGSLAMSGITSIGRIVFQWCDLTDVSFPDVTSVGQQVFQGCQILTSANFPAVTSLAMLAFTSESLSSVTLGTITSANFFVEAGNTRPVFYGNLREVYFAAGGGAGTYETSNPGDGAMWAKLP